MGASERCPHDSLAGHTRAHRGLSLIEGGHTRPRTRAHTHTCTHTDARRHHPFSRTKGVDNSDPRDGARSIAHPFRRAPDQASRRASSVVIPPIKPRAAFGATAPSPPHARHRAPPSPAPPRTRHNTPPTESSRCYLASPHRPGPRTPATATLELALIAAMPRASPSSSSSSPSSPRVAALELLVQHPVMAEKPIPQQLVL